MLDVLKNAATRAARRAPEDTSCEALFDDCTEALTSSIVVEAIRLVSCLLDDHRRDCHQMETSSWEK